MVVSPLALERRNRHGAATPPPTASDAPVVSCKRSDTAKQWHEFATSAPRHSARPRAHLSDFASGARWRSFPPVTDAGLARPIAIRRRTAAGLARPIAIRRRTDAGLARPIAIRRRTAASVARRNAMGRRTAASVARRNAMGRRTGPAVARRDATRRWAGASVAGRDVTGGRGSAPVARGG